jgi:hypothetical protein
MHIFIAFYEIYIHLFYSVSESGAPGCHGLFPCWRTEISIRGKVRSLSICSRIFWSSHITTSCDISLHFRQNDSLIGSHLNNLGIFVGASPVCSSHSIHGVFSPALVGGRLVLVECCCVGFARLYRF